MKNFKKYSKKKNIKIEDLSGVTLEYVKMMMEGAQNYTNPYKIDKDDVIEFTKKFALDHEMVLMCYDYLRKKEYIK